MINGCNNNSLANVIEEYDVSMELDRHYLIYASNVHEDKINDIHMISAKKNDDIIKMKVLKNLTEEDAMKYINNQKYLIDSIFTDSKVPYPGPLSNTLKCPEEFIPKTEEKEDDESFNFFYYLFANNRLTYDGCSEDILQYHAVIGLTYCKRKNSVFHIEFFTPINNTTDNYRDIVQSFRCEKS